MAKILLFGAGKSATVLISYLLMQAEKEDWEVTVADANIELIKLKTAGSPYAVPVSVDIINEEKRDACIRHADIVISLLPPSLHFLVAKSCLKHNKNLLTASYVDDEIRMLKNDIQQKGLLFLYEMGLDPGIDHMSAMMIIHAIKSMGGTITSFRSHCGGLVAPESDDNPWHYKISWNPRNIVMAGSSGAVYKKNNSIIKKTYRQVFENCSPVRADDLHELVSYPNRDSLRYISLYGLEEAATFERTTLRYKQFCEGWHAIVSAGLTDEKQKLPPTLKTYRQWSRKLDPYVNTGNRGLFEYLGLFSDDTLPSRVECSADVIQSLLEKKLKLKDHDRDMIVMVHEFEYIKDKRKFAVNSQLIVKGEDNLHTAMAKTVGLPLGIAAKLILNGSIKQTGLMIPVIPEIYDPVLKELAAQAVYFKESTIEI